MGLFDKKYCDICGEKIGLLGNRKLEDGNLCKACAKKLSPWFSDRRSSTVAEIKEQLNWREANRNRAAQFRTTLSFGERTKLLLDETHRWFTVTRAADPADDNSDVLDFSAITGCRTDIDEQSTELKIESKDSEGKTVRRSYNPPRYEYDYDFYITICVNVPYFSEMKFKLNDSTVHIPYQPTTIRWSSGKFVEDRRDEPMYDPCYRGFRETCDKICSLMESIRSGAANSGFQRAPSGAEPGGEIGSEEFANALKMVSWTCPKCRVANSGTATCQHCGAPLSDPQVIERVKLLACTNMVKAQLDQIEQPAQPAQPAQSWNCPFCGSANQGKFCAGCGAKKPEAAVQCSRCGWRPETPGNLPKFCPECGQPF